MLTELMTTNIRNGMLLESYSVLTDEDGDVFLQNVLDAQRGSPSDTMHIDPLAFGPLARVFAALERRRLGTAPVVVAFPVRVDLVGSVV